MNVDLDSPLFQFFAAHFSQDWPYDANTPDEVLDKYIAEQPQRDRATLADLIDAFVADHDDATIGVALYKELGCYYTPEADGQSARGWMQHVAKRLRSER